MNAFTYKDLTQRSGARRTSRLHRAPLAAALLALCVLFCLFGAAASAGAATSGFSAQGPLAQHALRSSPLSAAAEVFTPFGISWTQQVGASATPGTAIVKSPRGTITTTKPRTVPWPKAARAPGPAPFFAVSIT